jgi:hypothetical protein
MDQKMNNLRCKPGDLAVVIDAKYKRNLGIIVKVIEMDDRTGPVRYALETPVWLAESQKAITWVVNGTRYSSNRGPIPDAQLQPIRGAPKEQTLQREAVVQRHCGTFLLREGLSRMTLGQQKGFFKSLEEGGFLPAV